MVTLSITKYLISNSYTYNSFYIFKTIGRRSFDLSNLNANQESSQYCASGCKRERTIPLLYN